MVAMIIDPKVTLQEVMEISPDRVTLKRIALSEWGTYASGYWEAPKPLLILLWMPSGTWWHPNWTMWKK